VTMQNWCHLPSTALRRSSGEPCGRGKAAAGGEGEGLKGETRSQALTLARCASLSLSRKR